MSEISDNESNYSAQVYEKKTKLPKRKIKGKRIGGLKKGYTIDAAAISDIEEAYEDHDPTELKEDTLNNLFVLLECTPR